MAPTRQQFASDNLAGICPEVIDIMTEANAGHQAAYGNDIWTSRAANAFRTLFATDCSVFFVFNGTAANSLALSSLCRSYHGVICSDIAHVETDECGAPEFFSNGSKLLPVPTRDGKITPEVIRSLVAKRHDIHFPKPKVVTITQPTETGQVYQIEEIRAISATCRELGLNLHMDGARFSNACASLGCSPDELTWRAGVDVLCFGGTKNGMAVGEAIIYFDRALAEDVDYRCKQAGQLASKMRFLSAPWVAMLSDQLWLRNARHANAAAVELTRRVRDLPGVDLLFPTEANSVFLKMSRRALNELRERGWLFYEFIGGGARFMFAWDTDAAYVAALAHEIREVAIRDERTPNTQIA